MREIRREVTRKNAETRIKTWNVQKLEAQVAQQQEVCQSKLAEQQKPIEALPAGPPDSERVARYSESVRRRT